MIWVFLLLSNFLCTFQMIQNLLLFLSFFLVKILSFEITYKITLSLSKWIIFSSYFFSFFVKPFILFQAKEWTLSFGNMQNLCYQHFPLVIFNPVNQISIYLLSYLFLIISNLYLVKIWEFIFILESHPFDTFLRT